MKRRKLTTWNDINDPACERRDYQSSYLGAAYDICGRPSQTRVVIHCPFCAAKVNTYVWSLCGGGKRCSCGALFGSGGSAYKLRDMKGDI